MPACYPGQQPKAIVRHRVAVQVRDKPATTGMVLKPLQEAHHFGVGKVMGELRTDDEVGGWARVIAKDVAGAVVNAHLRRRRPAGGAGAPGVQVNAFQRHRKTAPGSKAANRAQQVTLAMACPSQCRVAW